MSPQKDNKNKFKKKKYGQTSLSDKRKNVSAGMKSSDDGESETLEIFRIFQIYHLVISFLQKGVSFFSYECTVNLSEI